MSQSFPFLAIAKKFNVSYIDVLQLVKLLDQGYSCSQYNRSVCVAVIRAATDERDRRISIANMAPSFQHNILQQN